MNYITPEQIKEYVNQNPTGIAGMSQELSDMVNHFAERIVRECAGVADDPNTDMLRVGQAIREHFGVES